MTPKFSQWNTVGHVAIKRVLEMQLASGKIPHAYAFVGPEGVGKKTLALEFANKILQTEKLTNHPDFSQLDLADDASVETMRECVRTIHFKPSVGAKRVVVINNAQLLSTQSGNGILKSLEEPPEYVCFILVSSRIKLLPTIMSRCQVFSFARLTAHDLQLIAQHHHVTPSAPMFGLSGGSAAQLMRLAANKRAWDEAQESEQLWSNLKQQPLAERLLWVNKLAELEAEELQVTFEQWLLSQTRSLSTQGDVTAAGALLESLRHLRTNKNKKFIIQSLLMKI